MGATLDLASDQSLYAQPRHIADPQNCFFYHTIELPGIGVVKGPWDLRGDVFPVLAIAGYPEVSIVRSGVKNGCFERRFADHGDGRDFFCGQFRTDCRPRIAAIGGL